MLDIILIAAGVGFFAVGILYTVRLRPDVRSPMLIIMAGPPSCSACSST